MGASRNRVYISAILSRFSKKYQQFINTSLPGMGLNLWHSSLAGLRMQIV